MKYTDTDRYQLSRACLKGCADEMEKAGMAMSAILDILSLDLEGSIEGINDLHRDGLLIALRNMSSSLERRSSFVMQSLEANFEEVGDAR